MKALSVLKQYCTASFSDIAGTKLLGRWRMKSGMNSLFPRCSDFCFRRDPQLVPGAELLPVASQKAPLDEDTPRVNATAVDEPPGNTASERAGFGKIFPNFFRSQQQPE